jgi:hypothetical protein
MVPKSAPPTPWSQRYFNSSQGLEVFLGSAVDTSEELHLVARKKRDKLDRSDLFYQWMSATLQPDSGPSTL